VLHATSLADYLERLTGSTEEQSLLRRELLIPVTHFFRDGELFDFLADEVITTLVQRSGIEPIRVWVACCATGEEAYSVAILFAEAFRRIGRSRPVKIFATDVEQQYLDQAGSAVYPDTIAAEVSAERLSNFFHERLGAYTVTPEVRQMVIFARHNLVADPPFTRMDLVSCRNALIYFQPKAQERALRRLQYALATGGHLVLGPSESLGILHRDFRPLASRHKVYQVLRRDRLAITLDGSGRHRGMAGRAVIRASLPAPDPQAVRVDNGQALLMQSYVPPSLLVSDTRELLHVYGDARRLLQIAEGQATLDVLKLLPRELGWAAGLALQAALEERAPQRSPPLRLPDSAQPVQLVARPLEAADGQRLVLLTVEAMPGDGPVPDTTRQADDGAAHQRRIEVLERELSLTHDSLQTTIEALETANEELQATNEELMASNEELQSTNEELQSVNEELYTVNSEYQEKVDILNSVNADLENVSRAAAIPTLFVDDALHLTRFTPEASLLFKVRDGDAGRSIEDFAHQLDYPDLFVDLRRTLQTGVAAEREVQSRNGDWWVARIQPYKGRTLGGTTRAVMTYFNVTSLKDSQRLQAVIDSLSEHLAVVDPEGCITMVNTAWRRFAADNGDTELRHSGPGSNYLRVCAQSAPDDEYARRAHDGLSAVLDGRLPVFRMQYPCQSMGRRLWFLMHAAPVAHRAGGAVVSHIDVTLWVEGSAVPDTMAQRD
jgi:two-component system, chemotaxis family, CheB/CheR fusion protein